MDRSIECSWRLCRTKAQCQKTADAVLLEQLESGRGHGLKSGSGDKIQEYVRRAPLRCRPRTNSRPPYSVRALLCRGTHARRAKNELSLRRPSPEHGAALGAWNTCIANPLQTRIRPMTPRLHLSSTVQSGDGPDRVGLTGKFAPPSSLGVARVARTSTPNPDSDKKPGFARLSSRDAPQPRCPAARFVGGTHSGTKQEHAKRRGIDEFGARYDWSDRRQETAPLPLANDVQRNAEFL